MRGTSRTVNAPASTLRLGAHEVEVWRAYLDEQSDETARWLEALLSADELDRASRFYFPRDRRRYVVGRGILRVMLGRYLGRQPRELLFRYGPNGKPTLASHAGEPPLHFNVAHSEGLALYAFTRAGEIGVDVERVRDLPDCDQVAKAAFSPHELRRLEACPPERKREEFFHAWARQEAVLKALGTGLTDTALRGSDEEFAVHPLKIDAGYAAALAVNTHARRPWVIFGWDELKDEGREARATGTQINLT